MTIHEIPAACRGVHEVPVGRALASFASRATQPCLRAHATDSQLSLFVIAEGFNKVHI